MSAWLPLGCTFTSYGFLADSHVAPPDGFRQTFHVFPIECLLMFHGPRIDSRWLPYGLPIDYLLTSHAPPPRWRPHGSRSTLPMESRLESLGQLFMPSVLHSQTKVHANCTLPCKRALLQGKHTNNTHTNETAQQHRPRDVTPGLKGARARPYSHGPTTSSTWFVPSLVPPPSSPGALCHGCATSPGLLAVLLAWRVCRGLSARAPEVAPAGLGRELVKGPCGGDSDEGGEANDKHTTRTM